MHSNTRICYLLLVKSWVGNSTVITFEIDPYKVFRIRSTLSSRHKDCLYNSLLYQICLPILRLYVRHDLILLLSNILLLVCFWIKPSCLLSIGVSKVFDRVDYSLLYCKLPALGVGGSLLQWLKSYLINRKLIVKFAL